jgi:hypothetical protein
MWKSIEHVYEQNMIWPFSGILCFIGTAIVMLFEKLVFYICINHFIIGFYAELFYFPVCATNMFRRYEEFIFSSYRHYKIVIIKVER